MTTSTRVFVSTVRDGDSFQTSGGLEVRLANVCAPEKGQTGFALAKQRLEALVLNRFVNVSPVATDVYGRTVANVHVGTIHVNEQMRLHGYNC